MVKEPLVVLALDPWASLPTASSLLILVTLRSQHWSASLPGFESGSWSSSGSPLCLTGLDNVLSLVMPSQVSSRLLELSSRTVGLWKTRQNQGVKFAPYLLRKYKKVCSPRGRSLHSATSQSLLKTSQKKQPPLKREATFSFSAKITSTCNILKLLILFQATGLACAVRAWNARSLGPSVALLYVGDLQG